MNGTPSRNEIRAAAVAVQRCFKAAVIDSSRRYMVPDIDTCELIAKSISAQAQQLGQSVGHSILKNFEQQAERLLAELPNVRTEIERLFRNQELLADVDANQNSHFQGIVQLQLAETAISYLLDRYGGREFRTYTWHDLALWVSLYGPGKDVAPEGPKCKFVGAILDELGLSRGQEAISATLRFRRGPRSRGKKDRN